MRTTLRTALAAAALAGMLLTNSGCLYRMPIQQGNFLNPTQVDQLETGMTRSQVSFLLGTPMIPNGFNMDRWDYYYYARNRRLAKPLTRRLTVWFKDDKVERIEKPDFVKAAAPSTPAATPPAP
jgi:outer membrane protein assembly factor BamE